MRESSLLAANYSRDYLIGSPCFGGRAETLVVRWNERRWKEHTGTRVDLYFRFSSSSRFVPFAFARVSSRRRIGPTDGFVCFVGSGFLTGDLSSREMPSSCNRGTRWRVVHHRRGTQTSREKPRSISFLFSLSLSLSVFLFLSVSLSVSLFFFFSLPFSSLFFSPPTFVDIFFIFLSVQQVLFKWQM